MKVLHLDQSFKMAKVSKLRPEISLAPWFGPVLWDHVERPLYGDDPRLGFNFYFVSRRVER